MKTKLQTLLTLLLFVLFIVAPTSPLNAINEITVGSNELPSSSYLKREKRSIANTLESSSLITPKMGLTRAGSSWADPFKPGENPESSAGGNVGNGGVTGPIGDASLPIVLSMLLLYIIYRGVSTSRRKNNF